MNKSLFTKLAISSLLALGCQADIVKADLIFSVDLDPAVSGMQDTFNLQVADSFQVDLYLELDNMSSLDSYRISLDFDNVGLQHGSSMAFPLPNYTPQVGGLGVTGNLVGPFEAASDTIGGGLTAPFGPTLIGSVSFTALSAGQFSIAPFEDPQLDGSFDNNFDQLFPSLRGGVVTISSVPEPNCVALLGIGLATSILSYRSRYLGSKKLHKGSGQNIPHSE